MREIKFRAWLINEKRMVQIIVMHLNGWIIDENNCCWNVNDYIRMQFTGLHDKNGKKIYYDSDIVEYIFDGETDFEKYTETVRGTVTLNLQFTNSLCVKTIDGRKYHFVACENNSLEVIGNIHENPELKGD